MTAPDWHLIWGWHRVLRRGFIRGLATTWKARIQTQFFLEPKRHECVSVVGSFLLYTEPFDVSKQFTGKGVICSAIWLIGQTLSIGQMNPCREEAIQANNIGQSNAGSDDRWLIFLTASGSKSLYFHRLIGRNNIHKSGMGIGPSDWNRRGLWTSLNWSRLMQSCW